MKRIILASTLLVFFVSLFTITAEAKENKNEKTSTFVVSMDCHNCVNKIQGNISYEKGIKDLKVSLDEKECVVTYRTDKTDEKKIIKAFNKLGYSAEVKKEKKEDNPEHQHKL